MKKIIYTLECKSRFLGKQRSESYSKYGEGVAQTKNGFGAKSTLQDQTCFGLERCGV